MSSTMMAQTEQWRQSRVAYDETTGIYRIAHEITESLSTNIVLSVAALEGVPATQLPPLAQVIDPDAIESIFSSGANATLSFTYVGYRVTLDGLDQIEILPLDSPRAPHRN